MHASSLKLMDFFFDSYVPDNSVVLDIGGSSNHESYKGIVLKYNSVYSSLDWNNADYIVEGYDWSKVPEKHFDVVISGQTFEHDPYFWKTLENIKRVVKQNGLVIIIVPSKCHFHQYPMDCYRFYPDSAVVFAEILNADIGKVIWNSEHAVKAINDKPSIDVKSIIFEHQEINEAGDLGMVFRMK
jgi:SAM-dependent methyltransferase